MSRRPAPVRHRLSTRRALPSLALTLLALVGAGALSAADDVPAPAPPAAAAPCAPPAAAPGVQASFATPEAAAKAFFDALEAKDEATLRSIVGPGNEDLVVDGKDPVMGVHRAALAAAAKTRLTLDRRPDGHVAMVVGPMDYPLALTLVAKDGAWRLDAAAGRQELLARRIGEHEMDALGICLAYVDAQVQYASKDRDEDGVKEYAQRLGSTPGRKDGLYWPSAPGEEESPAGPDLTPFREAAGPDAVPHAPFGGYYWRILAAQGPHAPGGAYSYVINGHMIAGFALIAVPAGHRSSGVMSFVTSNQGKVYEKDLGPDTLKVAAGIEAFDPDPSWREVDAATLKSAAQTSPEDAPFVPKGDGAEKPAGTPAPEGSLPPAVAPAAPAVPAVPAVPAATTPPGTAEVQR